MSVINKKLYTNMESQGRVAQIISEITANFYQTGMHMDNAFPLVPYLLHKASLYNNPFDITLQAIVHGKLDINSDAKCLAESVLNDKLWECLLTLVKKYSPEEFALVAITPVTDNEPKGIMNTPASILKLVHKLLDVRAEEEVADVCCGSGNYIVSAVLEEKEASYHGYEIDSANKVAAVMRAELLEADVEITLCDVFSVAEIDKMPKYDKIFARAFLKSKK